MRKVTMAFVALFICCLTQVNAQTKAETITQFMNDIVSVEGEQIQEGEPIASINTLAEQKAAKSIVLTKENVKDVLEEAKNYKNCVITVGCHTIVKLTSLTDCIQSGSWGTCMPKGEGFVQKRGLNPKNDYINNIIGRPDAQKRMVFFFDKI
ncbi:hypothetical protein DMA11_00195 [Marinilabiliaceae bacterium JC017]|nr:hypothetical protein DMA11_00195 [Marinilabiliaceae bacterium JC017]